jgi:triosephosphate isomerase (TIM)
MKLSAILCLASLSGSSAFVAPQDGVKRTTSLFARRPYITGNWKLNPLTKSEAIALAKATADAINWRTTADVALFVPFPFLEGVKDAVNDRITIGAQVSCMDCTVISCLLDRLTRRRRTV